MHADYAVELGANDEVLEIPWSAPDQGLHYYDLKLHPELLRDVQEAQRVAELGEFLSAVNSEASVLQTAKCDVWASTEINPEEEIFAAPWKFGSYVDLFFSGEALRFSLADHERLAKTFVDLLGKAPQIPASAEILIRQCYYHSENNPTHGYYLTFYLFGYDSDEGTARQRWTIALKLAKSALLQLSKQWG